MVTKLYILDTGLLCRNQLIQYFFQALEQMAVNPTAHHQDDDDYYD